MVTHRLAPLLLALCAAAWPLASCAFSEADYARSQTLGSDMKIYWNIDGGNIRLALETTATGWVGFGLAEMGRMPGSDIVYYEAASNAITDAYAVGFAAPVRDACQSWALVASENVGGKMRVEMTRALTSGDKADRDIVDDSAWPLEPTKVIAAWGNQATMTYHGTASRAQSTVRFFAPSAPSGPIAALNANVASSEYTSFVIKPSTSTAASTYAVPAAKTTYWEFDFPVQAASGAQNGSVPIHMVAAEAVITQGNLAYVHHFVLHGCAPPHHLSPAPEP